MSDAMSRPKIVDLCCNGGAASVGYHLAGFDVIGVDIVPMHEYPYTFHLAEALAFEIPDDAVAVHASPPCKAHTSMRTFAGGPPLTLFDPHTDMIAPMRAKLEATGLPYIIENVPGAPLLDPFTLCGSMFGLAVRRHRLFETNFAVSVPSCDHKGQGPVVGVYGNGGAWDSTNRPGGGGRKVVGAEAAAAMGITHTTTQTLLSQAIPPAYTRHIGLQLAQSIR